MRLHSLWVIAAVALAACDRDDTTPTVPRTVRPGLARMTTVPAWDASPFGIVGPQYSADHAAAGNVLMDSVARIGFKWVRVSFDWDAFQTFGPTGWNDSIAKATVQRATANGMKILGNIAYTPGWARQGSERYNPPNDTADFRRFVQAVVDSFPQVAAWSIWNESNCDSFKTPGQNKADQYAKLLAAAAPIVRSRGKPVVAGEFAWAIGPAHDCVGTSEADTRAFIANVVRQVTVTYGQPIDVIALHAYGYARDMIRAADTAMVVMYGENTDLPWSSWEVWLTEFADNTLTTEQDAAQSIGSRIESVFDAVRKPTRNNPKWTKIFYFSAQHNDGSGHILSLVPGWDATASRPSSQTAFQTNDPGYFLFGHSFSHVDWVIHNRPVWIDGFTAIGRDENGDYDIDPNSTDDAVHGIDVVTNFHSAHENFQWYTWYVYIKGVGWVDGPVTANPVVQGIRISISNKRSTDHVCYRVAMGSTWGSEACDGATAGTPGTGTMTNFRVRYYSDVP